jgi:hypothetical protein
MFVLFLTACKQQRQPYIILIMADDLSKDISEEYNLAADNLEILNSI